MPCSSPLKVNGYTVACRSCDYCVGRRVHSWCARAMMEKATANACLVVALTYNEETVESRDGARMFDYRHVSDFIKRLRRRIEYHTGQASALSFIACGEMGDRYGRCHWHVVLFGQVDFLTLGEWRARWGVVTDPKDIVSPKPVGGNPSTVWRRSWDAWPWGMVTVQEPDYMGMRYAMSYALKDQFNVRNSQGTARQAKAEVFATGHLAMSKKPPIGARFVEQHVLACAAGGFVPPTRRLSVPGLERPWWPTGVLAERLLAGYAGVNRDIFDRTGRNAAGWSTLLYEARDSDDDLETLGVFHEQDDESEADKECEENRLTKQARFLADARQRAQRRRQCGSSEACDLCLRGLPAQTLAELGILEAGVGVFARASDWDARNINGDADPQAGFARRQSDGLRKGPHPLCGLYADPSTRASDFSTIFPASACETVGEAARAGSAV